MADNPSGMMGLLRRMSFAINIFFIYVSGLSGILKDILPTKDNTRNPSQGNQVFFAKNYLKGYAS